jgi:ribose/xylose/arabinose/galactoside ABC-type transport system permease subunit
MSAVHEPAVVSPPRRRLTDRMPPFVVRNRLFFGALAFSVTLLLVFIIAAPKVFLDTGAYIAVFVSLPLLIILAIPQTFIVTSGEIDLSFSSVVGLCAFVFAYAVDSAGQNVWVALLLAAVVGLLCGLFNGFLVTYVGLSSLVATLGMYFLLRGLVQVASEGTGIPLSYLIDTDFRELLVGTIGDLPVQMIWAGVFTVIGLLLYNRHRFGAHIHAVGDNPAAARETGINVRRVKTLAFVYMGVSSAVVGVLATLINNNFFPTLGSGLLLTVIASVFVGGTPTFGGVGTVAGAVVGAFTVGFIETGIIAVGLTGFYTQFFYGLVIILSLIGLRYAARA